MNVLSGKRCRVKRFKNFDLLKGCVSQNCTYATNFNILYHTRLQILNNFSMFHMVQPKYASVVFRQ